MPAAKSQHRRSLALVCAGWVLAVLLLHIFSPRYQRLELRVRDQLAIFGRRAPVDKDLVFLAIDNASATLDLLMEDELAQSPELQAMKETGYPYRRDVYPLILERLMQAGAAVVAFDIMFPSEKELDPAFRDALEKYADRVVIGGNLEAREQAAAADEESRFRHTWVPPAKTLIPTPARGIDHRVGFVNFWPDEEDLVVRRARYQTTSEALEGLPLTEGSPVMTSLGGRILEKTGRAHLLPKADRPVLIRFAANIRPVSLYTIFVPELWALPPFNNGTFFRDKIVFIGPDGNWVKDELNTPFGLTNGPRLHLSALNAALRHDFLYEPPPWVNLLLIAGGGAVTWLLGWLLQNRLVRFLTLLGVAFGAYGAAQLAFNTAGWFPLIFSPLLALTASGVTFSVVEQVLDILEKTRLRRTFERYVSKDVVKELIDNPATFLNTLVGVRKPITVLFSDVRGFTTMTENADPHALVSQLNEYFNDMVGLVFNNQGTLDKFIGDAVMAHWGSIVSDGIGTDAQRAVATAVQMRESLARLNTDWRARGIMELKFGIGINHGEAIVGNLGCAAKMEVSVIGDAVNLASRLEGVTKAYSIDICVGETVEPLVRDAFVVRSLDLIVVKGKTKPVAVFAVLGPRVPGSEPPWLARHEDAMDCYRRGDFEAARAGWQEVLAAVPGDPIAEIFLERCAALAARPHDPAWAGVFEMQSK